MTQIDFENFFVKSSAEFKKCDAPAEPPHFASQGGSCYWDTGEGVIRQSDHWSKKHGVKRIKDCVWTIDSSFRKGEVVTGFCDYRDFKWR